MSASAATIVEIAARHARERGDALAYAFLADGADEAGRLTFAQLDAAARAIAAGLLGVATPGDRALLVYETGLDFVSALLGCLSAGIVAVPIPAPEASRMQGSIARLASVARDCGARLLLGNARTHGLLRDSRTDRTGIDESRWIDTHALATRPTTRECPPPALDALAWLQYTSGSTTTPKGVMISHANVVHHCAGMQHALGYDLASVSVCWMPHFHDYGLIEGILVPLFNGTPSYLMSPFSFLKRPFSWLEVISRFRGTHTQAFNFAYRYCAKRVTAAQRSGFDLGCLRSAGNGGEPIHPDTSEEFYRAFAECGLKREALAPVFGLAEATLLVTAVPVPEAPIVTWFSAAALGEGKVVPMDHGAAGAQRLVGCGRVLPETEVAIVDPDTRRRRTASDVGEIWVAGPGVARGYWQRERESDETFHARIAGEPTGRRYMRTGDLGFLHAGQLYISARQKDLIIIRGLNHYPQDIEWTVQQAHPLLRADNGAAFGVDVDGEERLCVVQELERGEQTDDALAAIMGAMSEAVSEQHGLQLHAAVLIKRASIPKTTSGKIQRRACRQEFLDGTLKAIATWPVGPEEGEMQGAEDRRPKTEASPKPDGGPTAGAAVADALIAWLRDYAERRINSRLIDERRTLPPNIVLDFGNRGVFGLQAPGRYGGLELGTRDTLRVYMQLAAIDATIATLVFLHNTNGVRPILHHARAALRDELMPILARGRELAAFALSEPAAGSNLGSVQARVEPDGDGWKIDGVKRWNGSAWTGVISVFARLVDADGRARGLTGFVVRQTEPGVTIGPESLTMGIRGIIQNAVAFDGVRVTADRMLGEPGKGMQVVEDALSHGRLATASVALGAALRSAQLILRYTSRREIETGLLLENPQAGVRISEMMHRIAIDREMLLYCGGRLDAGDAIVPEVAMAIKVSGTDTGNFAADLMVQLLGGRGYMENNLAPQILRDVRMLSIGEGANEGLVAAIGRSVRMGDAVQWFLRQYEPGGGLAQRLTAASAALAQRPVAGPFSGNVVVAWHDAVRGRLAIAALHVAAAMATGESKGMLWARSRFDELCDEAGIGTPGLASVLTTDEIRGGIDGYRDAVGDIEPLAPDVDYALDPLLQRSSGAPEAPVDQRVRGPDPNRERLRQLLLAKRSASHNVAAERGNPGASGEGGEGNG